MFFRFIIVIIIVKHLGSVLSKLIDESIKFLTTEVATKVVYLYMIVLKLNIVVTLRIFSAVDTFVALKVVTKEFILEKGKIIFRGKK